MLSGFSDDSQLYYWRILGAEQVMRLYRTDPAALSTAYHRRALIPLPRNASELGLAYAASMGSGAAHLHVPAGLYRGLRAPALDLLIELAARVRAISHTPAPLTVASTVMDASYARQEGIDDPPSVTGYTFQIARRYASHAQAEAFQAMLDRLQSLNLIGWIRGDQTIEITVASDADQVITRGV